MTTITIYKLALVKESSHRYDVERALTTPDKVVELGTKVLGLDTAPEEHLYCVALNTKLEISAVFEVSHGNVNSSISGIPEIMRRVLLSNCKDFVLLHNHPSGNPDPSNDDITTTKKISAAAKLLGMNLVDHVIIAGDQHQSLIEHI